MADPLVESDELALEPAQVVDVEAHGVWLETGGHKGCANCREGRGCGVSIFQRLFRLPRHRVFMPTEEPLSVGDHVVIGMAQRALLVASLWLYLAPLAALLITALILDLAFSLEWLTVAGGLSGLVGMLLIVRARQARQARSGRFFPVLHEVTLRATPDPDD
ncbi:MULTISPECIES: SoxR reducing system RseC family protein [unclassified Guyparkeria]|uniref:SoxR reducing system RseC family protein n=1 Tax=unclassified Guyparkeria TaxID=2626246 RepID=UPI0007339D91|nr:MULTISPECIES: SoxR reducing system RseC family protein [unclassified Guyparkeria]KTG16007.1 hypothetical protein AUR63_06040 [Guyparkeria sp. XI15]OAE84762.1 hypothetical protein AWR35_06050 [Guyparkeria sp. WRN-7]